MAGRLVPGPFSEEAPLAIGAGSGRLYRSSLTRTRMTTITSKT